MDSQQLTGGHSPDDGLLPLTAAQRGMWFAESLSAGYSINVAHYIDIKNCDRELDRELLKECIFQVAWEFESPFTRIVEVDGIPFQRVDRDAGFVVDDLDMRAEADPEAAAVAWMRQDYARPVDLLSDPLAIACLIQVADDRNFLYMRGHHIVLDGFSALSSLNVGLSRYNARVTETEPRDRPRASLAQLVTDDHDYVDSSRRARDHEYWVERTAELPERVTLSQRVTTAPLSPDNVVAGIHLDEHDHRLLDRMAKDTNASAASILTAAFTGYLARITGTDDVVLSLPVTGRTTAKIRNAGGMLSNMLPVRAREVTRVSFDELVAQVQLELTGALRHQRYRFEDIRVDAGLGDTNHASFGPIVNMMFFDKPVEIVGTAVTYHILSSGILEDLRCNLYQANPADPLAIDFHGNPHLYAQDELDEHVARFVAFLRAVLAAPAIPVADHPIVDAAERRALVELGRGPREPVRDTDLLAAFERQVRLTPDRVAVEFAGREWTYAEFSARRSRLADRLRGDGVGPGDSVVVALDRGIDQVCAIYAVLTAGAAYVPVDPEQPESRRAAIVETVDPPLVIDADYLGATGGTASSDAPGDSDPAASGHVTGDPSSAYVIFTSGSTGTPKGVEVGHRAIVNRLEWMQRDHPLDSDDVVLYKTPFTFDVSVWELFWPLQHGARMVIAAPGGHRDPEYLYDTMRQSGVTMLHFVPSMLDTYLDVVAADGVDSAFPESVSRVFTSGEALGGQLAGAVIAGSDVGLVNLYGPTEAAVDVTEHVVRAEDSEIPIGRPVANTEVLVLDAQLRPVPVGVAGELYLGGYQLATGYKGRPDLTADRFVANPHADGGARMYRTGDLVRWSRSGELEYLGRTDFQIKIRGQRVELGEIEAVLREYPGVDAAVAVARSDGGRPARLVAYVRALGVRTDDIAAWCRRRLPLHMVPSAVVALADFPVTSSGKLDRKALPEPTEVTSEHEYVAPTSRVEIGLTSIVADLVGGDRIGLRDSLFRVGGDSLSAARLVSRARAELRVGLGLTDVFDSADLGELAARAVPLAADVVEPLLHAGPRPEIVPLSSAQTRLWFINRMDPAAGTYNMAGTVTFDDDVDPEVLSRALADVVDRHEPLRTRFPAADGEPRQDIRPVSEVCEELRVEPREVGANALDDLVITEAGHGFDLTADIPFRTRAWRVGGRTVLLLVLHHIAGDGASLPPLIRDIMHAYDMRRAGREPEWADLDLQYADFALWQRDALGDIDEPASLAARELEHWRSALHALPELIELPTDRPRPRVASGAGAYLDVDLDDDLARGIVEIADRVGVTPFIVAQAAVAVVLGRLAGTEDIPVGVAVAGRDQPGLDDLVGMFVNTVVLRTRTDPAPTVADLLAAVRREFGASLGNSSIPFEQVVEALAPHRSLSHTPMYQVATTWQDDPLSMARGGGAFDIDVVRIPSAKCDLAISFTQSRSETGRARIGVEFAYATDLFDESSVVRIASGVTEVLRGMIADPQRRVGTLDLVPPAEIAAATHRGGEVTPRTFAEVVEIGTAIPAPTATAISGDYRVTYGTLVARTNQLARELIARGVGPGDMVAIEIPRSHHSVLATLAVVKSGAGFVLVDPKHPAGRRADMIADAGAGIGLRVAGEHTDDADIEWVELDDADVELQIAGHEVRPVEDTERVRPISLDDVAYLIFTSGSTGKPKATAISHRGIANFAHNLATGFGADAHSRVLHVSSPSFDASVLELVLAMSVGAELVVSPPDVYAGDDLAELLARHGVTHALMTPSVLATVEPGAVPSLGTVLSGGEALTPELVTRWSHRRLFNLYGPTEATVWVTVDGPVSPDDEVTIGHALPGVDALILDAALRPVPVGVPGELYLAGDQVGLGYMHRPGLSATRFIADPFAAEPGRRMYRTGDRVTRRLDGRLIYHGRTDFQLKIRGLRIEPGEVDVVLGAHPEIDGALSMGVPGPGGEPVLVSFVTARGSAVLQPEKLMDYARDRLPQYMVPQTITVLDEFPLTSVGKVDRNALPDVDFAVSRDFVPPRTQLEVVLADLFAQVLRMERVSVHDGFFELGGNSLSATKLTARLSSVLERQISVRDVFESPSVAQLAERVSDSLSGGGTPPLTARRRAEMVPVSTVQRGMWLLNRADPDSAAYNVSMALRLEGDLDVPALNSAVVDLIRRHESLRTTYPMINNRPIQVIVPPEAMATELEIDVVDVDGSVTEAIAAETAKGFDVTERPPVRLVLFRTGPAEHVLVFVVHHISADGASMAPLARDLMLAYAARCAGGEPTWRPLPIQYADFSLWQADKLALAHDGVSEEERQLEHWSARLAGVPEVLDLPTDRPRPRTPSFAGDEVRFEIPGEVVRSLETIARVHNTTLFMVTHAAFAVLLNRISGREDIVIGTPYAGRGDQALEDIVGMFVNTLPLRTVIRPDETFSSLLARVRGEDLADMSNTDVAFESIVSRVLDRPSASYNPLFQVMFAFQNFEFPTLQLEGLRVTPLPETDVAAKVDLHLTLIPEGAGNGIGDGAMSAQLIYAQDLFDRSTVDRIAGRYLRVLEAVVADPSCIVGDTVIHLADELQADDVDVLGGDAESAHADIALPELVAAATRHDPSAAAIVRQGVVTSFGQLEAMMGAMRAALPDSDADAALAMALMSTVTGLANDGPDALDAVLGELRAVATEVSGMSSSEAHRK